MASRTPFLAGNWKMNQDQQATMDFMYGLSAWLQEHDASSLDVALFPSYLSIPAAIATADDAVIVGAQTVASYDEGAYTGEVSAGMIADAGCGAVLVGHSERREYFGETEKDFVLKVEKALAAGLHVVYCVGETLDQRKAGSQDDVVRKQLDPVLRGLDEAHWGSVSIAYEPVWAIGTGETASPEQAQEMHAFIRGWLASAVGAQVADTTRVLYGGSMKPGNAKELLSQPDVDGGLIGGASLQVQGFTQILSHALS
ncbi:MAG: triose-phosphate isomerase [Balneolaceae bacterium]|nr:triose-phosphate isomerase [Balneolaceae bacterium]